MIMDMARVAGSVVDRSVVSLSLYFRVGIRLEVGRCGVEWAEYRTHVTKYLHDHTVRETSSIVCLVVGFMI